MDFAIREELAALLAEIDAFINARVIPLEQTFLMEGVEAVWPALQEVRGEVKARGWWLPHLPAEHHGLKLGMGLSLMEYGMVSERLGRSLLGHVAFNAQAPDAGNMEILIEHGTPAQQETFLKPLLAGEVHSCFGMTEPDHPGSNPVWMGTRAERDGDDYVINGRKWFTTAADGAAFCIVMAVTDPDAPKHRRASQIIVPMDTPGFELVRNLAVMERAHSGFASHAEVSLQDVRVPVTNRLGGEGAGFAIAQDRLGPGRIHHCMRWLGICERAFALMCTRAVSRQLRPGEPLGAQQIVQTWVADSRAEIDAAKLMVLRAAWRIDHEGTKAARHDISLIKFTVANTLQRVLDRAIQTWGGAGMLDDLPLAYWYRHERAARIYDGADEVHRASVARSILKGFTPDPAAEGAP